MKPSGPPVDVKVGKVTPGGVTQGEFKLLVLVTIIAFFVRTYKIGQPSSVV
jgi:dolichyl-phosphate-mannose--protein O-mannosyl transferase